MKYTNTYIDIEPGTVIEKTFYLDIYGIKKEGSAFQPSLYKSIDIFIPFYADDLPEFEDIIRSKYRFAKSRWFAEADYDGFNMYPGRNSPQIVMGWCGQAASCGYAFQNLQELFSDPELPGMVQKSLYFLSTSPIGEIGFPVRYDSKNNKWTSPDHVSMGQEMYNFAKAIQAAKKSGKYNTTRWENFLKGAWAAFQGFLAVYEMTGDAKHLEWAKHACDVCLSYTVNWDIPLPAGRMADHFFKTRGWTLVSPQNQHVDVFGIFYTPEIYKMGLILEDERLKKLAIVIYRICGQLIIYN